MFDFDLEEIKEIRDALNDSIEYLEALNKHSEVIVNELDDLNLPDDVKTDLIRILKV